MAFRRRITITPRLTAAVASSLIVLAILGYFAYRLLPAFRKPQLIIEQPATNVVVTTPEFMVFGKVELGMRLASSYVERLTINRDEVYLDETGHFSQPVYLASGVNALEFIVESRFGRKTKVTRYIIYKK